MISNRELAELVEAGVVDKPTAGAIRAYFDDKCGDRPRLDATSVGYYFGTLVVMVAFSWFLLEGYDRYGGGSLMMIAPAYAALFMLEGRILFAVAAMAVCAGCSPGAPASSDASAWVGTITAEGNVTTVINESGSVWGGTATLVEEASIGVDVGADEYMLGNVRSLGATADRIYVLQRRLALVRVYDMGGVYLFDVGGRGQGPGEFTSPWAIAIDPGGRLIVQETARVTVFDLDGALSEVWPRRSSRRPSVITGDGTAFIPTFWNEGDQLISGVVAVAPDGSEGRRVSAPAYDSEPWQLYARGDVDISAEVPYATSGQFAVLPSGAIVRGISDAYRLEIEHADGRHKAIERIVELPAVPDADRQWLTDYWTAEMRSVQPDWAWTANAVPDRKLAFERFFGDRWGRIWVHRIIGSEAVAECAPSRTDVAIGVNRRCWRDLHGLDVFEEASGRFLGQVKVPSGARISAIRWPAFLEDGLLLAIEDKAGTIMVKRYRLVLPGEV